MSFKVTETLQDILPVKQEVKEQPLKSKIRYISAEDVTIEMMNSTAGIDSKWCYIGRINEITGEVSSPTLKVIGDKPIHL